MPSMLEILEAHSFGHSLLTVRGFCNGCDWNSYTGPKVAIEEHRHHVAQVLDEAMREREAEAWEEGFQAGWEEHESPGPFVNDYWDAKTPNPYRKESSDGR